MRIKEDGKIYNMLLADLAAVPDVISGFVPGKKLNLSNFDTTQGGNFQRLYSIMIGDRPAATVPVAKNVYSVIYNTNDDIDRYWSNLNTLEDTTVRSIILGNADITAFDSFVDRWMAEGGAKVLEAVQEQYDIVK